MKLYFQLGTKIALNGFSNRVRKKVFKVIQPDFIDRSKSIKRVGMLKITFVPLL